MATSRLQNNKKKVRFVVLLHLAVYLECLQNLYIFRFPADEFSHMSVIFQFACWIKRIEISLELLRVLREKILPDSLTCPYTQPSYTNV
jgi:hypothetical protein